MSSVQTSGELVEQARYALRTASLASADVQPPEASVRRMTRSAPCDWIWRPGRAQIRFSCARAAQLFQSPFPRSTRATCFAK